MKTARTPGYQERSSFDSYRSVAWCCRLKNVLTSIYDYGDAGGGAVHVAPGEDVLESYRGRAERDWNQMVGMKRAIEKGARPGKRYRVSNCFVDTRPSCRFPLDFASKEEAMDHAVGRMVCGREGLFVLLTNRPFTRSTPWSPTGPVRRKRWSRN